MISLPRIRFAVLPTPVEPMPRLSTILGGPRLLVKRDDLTGLAFGGNKTRKLEYVLAEVLANGARTLITVGAAQSNHCRQTAALAARYGLECILVLSGEPGKITGGNLLLDELFGAEIVWTTRAERDVVLRNTFNHAWEAGKRPFLVPLGASTPTGTLGYVTAWDELMQQGVMPDWIVVASSSGGTQAGLSLGAKISGSSTQVLGISIDNPAAILKKIIADLANQAADRLAINTRLSAAEVLVNDAYLGAGYGKMGAAEKEAIHLFAKTEGLLLDPVYTGRAAAGCIDLIRNGFFRAQDTVLFWHTGGTPALFASEYEDQFV